MAASRPGDVLAIGASCGFTVVVTLVLTNALPGWVLTLIVVITMAYAALAIWVFTKRPDIAWSHPRNQEPADTPVDRIALLQVKA